MSKKVDVDFKSFLDYTEQDVRFSDEKYGPPQTPLVVVARKLCTLAFEARDSGLYMMGFTLVALARLIIEGNPEEIRTLIDTLTPLPTVNELLQNWAERSGIWDETPEEPEETAADGT